MINSCDESDFIPAIASPVVTDGYKDYAVNEGIYKMEFSKIKLSRKTSQHIEIGIIEKALFFGIEMKSS